MENKKYRTFEEIYEDVQKQIQVLDTSTAGFAHIGLGGKNINQDRILLQKRENMSYILTVADGLGGMSYGELAADALIEVYKKYGTSDIAEDVFKHIAWQHLRQKLTEKYASYNMCLSEIDSYLEKCGISSTCFISSTISADGVLKCTQAGDVKMVIGSKNGTVKSTIDETFGESVANSFSTSSFPVFTQSHTLLQEGDKVIIASDGLWKNFSEDDVLSFIDGCENANDAVKVLAKALYDKMYNKYYNKVDNGARYDNISIVVHFFNKQVEIDQQKRILQSLYAISDSVCEQVFQTLTQNIAYDTSVQCIINDNLITFSPKGKSVIDSKNKKLAYDKEMKLLLSKKFESYDQLIYILEYGTHELAVKYDSLYVFDTYKSDFDNVTNFHKPKLSILDVIGFIKDVRDEKIQFNEYPQIAIITHILENIQKHIKENGNPNRQGFSGLSCLNNLNEVPVFCPVTTFKNAKSLESLITELEKNTSSNAIIEGSKKTFTICAMVDILKNILTCTQDIAKNKVMNLESKYECVNKTITTVTSKNNLRVYVQKLCFTMINNN